MLQKRKKSRRVKQLVRDSGRNEAMSKNDKDEDSGEAPGPVSSALVIVKYGPGKTLAINPNAGLAGIMERIRQALNTVGLEDVEHIELCDESGKLLNPNEFPPMMWLSSFIKPESEEVWYIPIKVERDGKQVLKAEPLLTEDKMDPEMMAKMKKENHVAKERKPPKTDSARMAPPEETTATAPGSAHPSKLESKKGHGAKSGR